MQRNLKHHRPEYNSLLVLKHSQVLTLAPKDDSKDDTHWVLTSALGKAVRANHKNPFNFSETHCRKSQTPPVHEMGSSQRLVSLAVAAMH